jgi:hypothetical protein
LEAEGVKADDLKQVEQRIRREVNEAADLAESTP